MKKGVFASFILMMVLSVALSACSGGTGGGNASDAKATTKDSKVIVNFWSFWGSETRRPVIEKMIKDFNESQDEIEVKHTFVPWGDIWTKNLASVAAGNPADVIVGDINTVDHRAKNNQSEDLSQFINEDIKNELYPNLWDSVEYKGKFYGVPFTTDTRLLFYNKDAYREAGLNPNKPPATWAELEEHAKQLDQKQGNTYKRIGFYPTWGSFGAGSWMANADGGKGFFEGEDMYINTPKKAEALQWLVDYRKRIGEKNVQAFEAEFGSGQTNPFISGKVALWTDVGTFYTQLRDSKTDMDFGVAPMPAFEKGDRHWNEGGGFVLEIPKGAKHPKEAAKFIEYMTGEKAQKYWALKNYDNVANKKAALSVIQEMSGKEKEVYQQSVKNLDDTKLHPVPISYPDYASLVNPKIDAALQGKLSPEQALKQAEQDVKNSKK
ncbi:ABC transporter substrate-binding protein [Bacillus massiliglaciei]|uniref:ABC transporter substrate-binding protein n=1 Tax=Bacillus massiliglaciei TaxID=1816693 RepID=UPI000A768E05|nr:ABC transporter substrate-binding protein [Bacillus massiliglaciei]